MKRIALTLLLIWLWAMPQAWAAQIRIEDIEILPLSPERLLVKVKQDELTLLHVYRHRGFPAIWLSNAEVDPLLSTPDAQLRRDVFLRPVPFPVRVVSGQDGTWLQFETATPLKLSVVSTNDAFLEEAARELPLYPKWQPVLSSKPEPPMALMNRAITAFQAGNLQEATQILETLFLSMQDPPEPLYQLLGALYLYQESWLRALLLYGQGSQSHTDTLGLRYSALLYRMHQPDKAIDVLSSLLVKSNLSLETLGQAQYMLGSIFEEKGDYQRALPHLQAAAAVYQESPVVLYNLALAYEKTNQPAYALKTYQMALPITKSDLMEDIQAQMQRLQSAAVLKQIQHPQVITLGSQDIEEVKLVP